HRQHPARRPPNVGGRGRKRGRIHPPGPPGLSGCSGTGRVDMDGNLSRDQSGLCRGIRSAVQPETGIERQRVKTEGPVLVKRSETVVGRMALHPYPGEEGSGFPTPATRAVGENAEPVGPNRPDYPHDPGGLRRSSGRRSGRDQLESGYPVHQLFQVAHPESLPAARQVAGGQTDRGSRGVDSATRRGGQTARYSKEQRSRMQESVGSRSTVPRTRRPGIRTNKDNQRTWKKIPPICPARLRLNVGNVGCYPTF